MAFIIKLHLNYRIMLKFVLQTYVRIMQQINKNVNKGVLIFIYNFSHLIRIKKPIFFSISYNERDILP